MTPAERKLRSQIAVKTSWANTANRTARTAPAREKSAARFEKQARELHPDAPEAQIRQAATALAEAHMARMTLKSIQARAAKKAAQAQTA